MPPGAGLRAWGCHARQVADLLGQRLLRPPRGRPRHALAPQRAEPVAARRPGHPGAGRGVLDGRDGRAAGAALPGHGHPAVRGGAGRACEALSSAESARAVVLAGWPTRPCTAVVRACQIAKKCRRCVAREHGLYTQLSTEDHKHQSPIGKLFYSTLGIVQSGVVAVAVAAGTTRQWTSWLHDF